MRCIVVNVKVLNQGIFDWGGGVGPNFGSEGTVELLGGRLLLTEKTTCFSRTCERRSPSAREILLCEERRTDHRRVLKNN